MTQSHNNPESQHLPYCKGYFSIGQQRKCSQPHMHAKNVCIFTIGQHLLMPWSLSTVQCPCLFL